MSNLEHYFENLLYHGKDVQSAATADERTDRATPISEHTAPATERTTRRAARGNRGEGCADSGINGANRGTDPQEKQWEQLKTAVERASEQASAQEPEGQERQVGRRSTGAQGKRHEDRPGAGRSHRALANPVQRLSPCRNLQAAVLRDAV